MAKTIKRKQTRKRQLKQGVLAPLEVVERDMRRAVKREKNVQRLQKQIVRELKKSRAALAVLVNFLETNRMIERTEAVQQEKLIK